MDKLSHREVIFLFFHENWPLKMNSFDQYRSPKPKNVAVFFFYADTQTSNQDLQTPSSPTVLHLLQTQHPSPSILPSASSEDSRCTDSPEFDSPSSSKLLAQDTSSGPSPASSPEIAVDHSTASLDSEQEHDGIFLDFSRHRGGDSSHSRDSSQQSVCWHEQDRFHTGYEAFLPPCDSLFNTDITSWY